MPKIVGIWGECSPRKCLKLWTLRLLLVASETIIIIQFVYIFVIYTRRHKNGDVSVPCKRKRIPFLCSWKRWMVFNETRIEQKRNGTALCTYTLYWHGAVCISGTCVRLLTSLEANSFSSGRLHVSDRHWPSWAVSSTEKWSLQRQTTASSMEQCPATLERSTTVHGAVTSDKQLGRYLKNGDSITEVNAISMAACKVGPGFLKLNFYFSILIMSMDMGVVLR